MIFLSLYRDDKEDHYYERELQIEIYDKIEHFTKIYSHQKVIKDTLQSIQQKEIDKEKSLEILTRDIVKTLSKTKYMSDKQKRCLVTMLVLRGETDYK